MNAVKFLFFQDAYRPHRGEGYHGYENNELDIFGAREGPKIPLEGDKRVQCLDCVWLS